MTEANEYEAKAVASLRAIEETARHLAELHAQPSTAEIRGLIAAGYESIRQGHAAAKVWSHLAVAQEVRRLREVAVGPSLAYTEGKF